MYRNGIHGFQKTGSSVCLPFPLVLKIRGVFTTLILWNAQRLLEFKKDINILVARVHVYRQAHACHSVHMQVRGQFYGVVSLLPPWPLGMERRSSALHTG